MPFGFHPMYLVVLLVIVLVIFGPGKLPHLGGAIGKSMREFRRSAEEVGDQIKGAGEERTEGETQRTGEAPQPQTPSSEQHEMADRR